MAQGAARAARSGAGRRSVLRRAALWIGSIAFCSLTLPLFGQGEPREPGAGATPHKVYETTSRGGLRYTWVVPAEPAPAGERALTILLHGTGLDYRWGHANHPAGKFRPNDVVISVDGTSPAADGSRLFLGEKKDVDAFHELLVELRERFAVDRVFLYGHSQGGFFVAYYAGERPEDIAGVVAHASGAWSGSKTTGGVRDLPIVFLHGTADPVVPYTNSTGTRDHYRKQGLDLARLRRLPGYNHWPNSVRAGECLDWCAGMVAKDAAYAFSRAEELLRPKGKDSVEYQTAVDFAGAASILERFTAKSPRKLEKIPKAAASAAKALLAKVDAAGKEHRQKIQKGLRGGLRLDGGAWLGHLLAVREDFRGVPSIEELCAALSFDERAAEHAAAARRALAPWYDDRPPAAIYSAAVEEIPNAFLSDAWPVGYAEKLVEWHAAAEANAIPAKDRARFAAVEAWRRGLEEGEKAYRELWLGWK